MIRSMFLILVGCGGGAEMVTPDAMAPPDVPVDTVDLSCLGRALPTTAPAVVTISGNATTFLGAGLANATVTAYARGNATALATTTSDGNGGLSISAATNGMPIDGYVRVLQDTNEGYSYGATPIAADIVNAQLIAVPFSLVMSLATGVDATQSAMNGALQVQATDCAGVPMSDVVFTTEPAGILRYGMGSGLPSSTATTTDLSGVAYIFDLPPGPVTLNASYHATALRGHVVDAFAGAASLAAVKP